MAPATATTKPPATDAPATDSPAIEPGGTEPAPAAAGRLAIGYAPEVIETALRRCPGGDISWVFGITAQGPIGITLSPGLNLDVDVALWERAKGLEAVQDLIVQNVLQEIPLPAVDEGITSPWLTSLTAIPTADARRMIHYCHDLEQLKAWLKVENRELIRRALVQRIKERQQGLESIQGIS